MSDEKKGAEKRAIRPVTLTVTVEASRISEKGTFSGFVIKSVKGPNKTTKAVSPPSSGGAIYLQVTEAEGIEFLTSGEVKEKKTVKLF